MLLKLSKSRFLPLLILLALCFAALFLPTHAQTVLSQSPVSAGDTAWMLTATALVLLMTPGLSFFYGGMVSKKNVISTMLQSFIAMGLISILWVVCGFSLSFGESIGGIIGSPLTFPFLQGVGGAPDATFAATIPFGLFALFQLKFAIITPALITGSFAERVRFSAYLLFICLFSICIYAPLAHMTWHPHGLLRQLGVLDFAGGTVVHMSAGFAALAGALYLGKRNSYAAGVVSQPAHIPFVLLGTGMLWFGWFGFNAGSALAANEVATTAFLTTNTASAAAMLAWIFLDIARGEKPTALGACIGAVVGLVAITPAAGFVTVGISMLIGAVSAVVSNIACSLKGKVKLDDTLDVFPCHGLGGVMGMMLTGVFAKDVGLFYGSTQTFIAHVGALVVVGAGSFVGSYLLYMVTDFFIPLRVPTQDELAGLDISQHGESMIHAEQRVRTDSIVQELIVEHTQEPGFIPGEYQ
jgi:Amt family ammonium transporter